MAYDSAEMAEAIEIWMSLNEKQVGQIVALKAPLYELPAAVQTAIGLAVDHYPEEDDVEDTMEAWIARKENAEKLGAIVVKVAMFEELPANLREALEAAYIRDAEEGSIP